MSGRRWRGRCRRCRSVVHVIDTRPEELAGLPENVEARAVAMPEAVVRAAPRGSSYVILTHDHALDFLIASEALKRADAPYVGMVGSKTKRAQVRQLVSGRGGRQRRRSTRLVLPIGGGLSRTGSATSGRR